MLGEEALSTVVGFSRFGHCVRLPLVRALIQVKPAASGFFTLGFYGKFLILFLAVVGLTFPILKMGKFCLKNTPGVDYYFFGAFFLGRIFTIL
jgi:hypothetical protein